MNTSNNVQFFPGSSSEIQAIWRSTATHKSITDYLLRRQLWELNQKVFFQENDRVRLDASLRCTQESSHAGQNPARRSLAAQ
jgi:hypothetical protein